jgi:hypothetical protein
MLLVDYYVKRDLIVLTLYKYKVYSFNFLKNLKGGKEYYYNFVIFLRVMAAVIYVVEIWCFSGL